MGAAAVRGFGLGLFSQPSALGCHPHRAVEMTAGEVYTHALIFAMKRGYELQDAKDFAEGAADRARLQMKEERLAANRIHEGAARCS